MAKSLRKDWQHFLETGAYSRPPGRAACALSNARVLADWAVLEGAGLVRVKAEPEQENYFAVYGEPEGYTTIHGRKVSAEQERKEIERQLDNLGCWYVSAEYWDGTEWQFADGVGMCTGYNDPTSPFENCYVPDMMRSAIEKLPQPGEH